MYLCLHSQPTVVLFFKGQLLGTWGGAVLNPVIKKYNSIYHTL
jgi:hypothetical protein